jgi:hypothetical protein
MWVTEALKANYGVIRLKRSVSRFSTNQFIFYLHLMFHECVQRFDGMDKIFLDE